MPIKAVVTRNPRRDPRNEINWFTKNSDFFGLLRLRYGPGSRSWMICHWLLYAYIQDIDIAVQPCIFKQAQKPGLVCSPNFEPCRPRVSDTDHASRDGATIR